MTKHENGTSHQSHSRDMTVVWEARGYRKDLAGADVTGAEDPQGEAAYQRAFAHAAQQKPPRVPNPESYPNSPSAQEYIRQRNRELFPSIKPVKVRSSSYVAPIPDIHRPQPKEEPLPAFKSSPRSVSSKSSKSTPKMATSTTATMSNSSAGPIHASRPVVASPPQFLEPKLAAPVGPTKRLR